MKRLSFVFIAALALLMAGCSHNASLMGLGTSFRIGSGEASLNYADGLFLNSVSRDNMKFTAELDATMGLTYEPSSGTYKGIKAISYEIGPQLGGYSQKLGEVNPDALRAYYEATAKYYEYRRALVSQPVQNKTAISEEKSKSATVEVADILKKAIDKAKSLIGKKEKDEGKEATFQCDGNCEYADLSGNGDISYQLSIAMKLLTYDGYSNKMKDTSEYYTTTLEHFVTQLVSHQAKGNKETPLRVKYVTVKDGVITRLMYVMCKPYGNYDVDCPSCVTLD